LPKSTVLLFSPESAAREEVRAILAGVGYPVTVVSDRAEALTVAANHQVLVVDLPASRNGAAEFCRAVRRDAGLALVPILAIAQADDVEERIELIEAGVDEVIARPFDPRELEARMVALELRVAQTGDAAPEPVAVAEPRVERRLIVCFGPKGGTGTTTIAVNVAVALANLRPDAVALIDLDTQFGDVVTHLDISAKRTITDLAADDPALDDAELMRSYATTVESGLHVYAAPASPALAELITPEVVTRLLKTARATYEVVVIDAGSHLDEATLNVLESADALIVAIRPEMAALKAVLSLNAYLREIEALRSSTIYVANHLFAKEMVRLRDIEDVLGARVAVEIPYDPYAFLKAVNEGVPIVRAAPRSVAAQRLARLAAMALGESRVVERPAPQGGGRRRLLPGLRASR
jgi:pilus assembly protein CpaE